MTQLVLPTLQCEFGVAERIAIVVLFWAVGRIKRQLDTVTVRRLDGLLEQDRLLACRVSAGQAGRKATGWKPVLLRLDYSIVT